MNPFEKSLGILYQWSKVVDLTTINKDKKPDVIQNMNLTNITCKCKPLQDGVSARNGSKHIKDFTNI